MQQYTPGQRIEYRCAACGKRVTGTVEGIMDTTGTGMGYDLVIATCDACGSTRTVARLPRAEGQS
jgi:DNA-directed RNA polymerase subunit RPC12/RpoP